MMGIMANQTQAQNYVIFDGEDFSVKIKVNDDETSIEEVYFSDATKENWTKLTIDNSEQLEEEGGYVYYVKNDADSFTIDFYSFSEEITVTNSETWDSWVLQRNLDE